MTTAALSHMQDRGPTPRTAAVIAGIGYVLLFVLAIFANFVVLSNMVETGDAAATFANIAEDPTLFRFGVLSFLIVFVLDVVVAWALFILFAPANRELSRVTAWFRIVYTVFLGVALIFSMLVLQLVGEVGASGAFDQAQLDTQVTLFVNAFDYAWLIGLVAFGIHLLLIGWIMLSTGAAPKALGVVLAVAGAVYLVDTTANVLMANYAEYEDVFLAIVAIPAVIGEFAFTIWLLARGGKARAEA